MPFVFSIKDTYRQAVEAQTGGKNTVMYDDKGNPSIMVRVPKIYLDEIIDGAEHVAHPAFIVNGIEKSEIWISKYQNIIHDSRAYSVPSVDPKTTIDFNTAKAACEAKGSGWHLMTNAEWAAIALWCRKAGLMPRGNNDYGCDHSATYERGVYAPGRDDRILTGSGPASWNHDGTPEGIADLNGNIREWVDGLKLVDGKIYVHNDNDFDTGNTEGSIDGWVDTLSAFDYSASTLQLDATVTTTMDEASYEYASQTFESLTSAADFTVPDLLKHLGIAPVDAGDHGGDYIYVCNYGERLPSRGGLWIIGSRAGVFHLYLRSERSYSRSFLGFRSAFISV